MKSYFRNLTKLFSIIFFIVIFGGFPAIAQVNTVTVTLLEDISISSEKIYLEDIANLSEIAEPLLSNLERVLIGPAPLPGRSRNIPKSIVMLRLAKEKLSEKVILDGAAKVKVKRVYNAISGQFVAELLRQYVRDNFPSSVRKLQVEVINPPAEIILPSDDTSLNFSIPIGILSRGRVTIQLVLRSGNNFKKIIPFSVNIRTFEDVLVTNRQLYRNSNIRDDDFRVELRETTKASSNKYINSFDEVKDKRLVRGVSANRILRSDMLRNPPLITRGTQLTLKVITKNLVVLTSGMAREDGQLNDWIEVQPLPSGKRIKAKILNSSTVVVEI